MTDADVKAGNKTAVEKRMEEKRIWNDATVVMVRDNEVELALKLLRKRMHNAEIFKQLKTRRKNLPFLRHQRDRGKRIREKKSRQALARIKGELPV